MSRALPYSDGENVAVSTAYAKLAVAQFVGVKVKKIGVIAELMASTGRSDGSIQSKFMNYSAAAVDNNLLPGLPNGYVKGYKPAGHAQKGLADYLIVALARELWQDDTGSAVLSA